MNSITRTSVSVDPLLNQPDHESLHQNNIENSTGTAVTVVSNSNQHTEGKKREQAIEDHYPGISNLATFSESITTSNTMNSSLEGRIALQPRGLHRDIEQASAMLTACRLEGSSSSKEISHAATSIRKIITRTTIQVAANLPDSLEESKDERIKLLIENNEKIRDMMNQGDDDQILLNTLGNALQHTQNIIEGREATATAPPFTTLQGEEEIKHDASITHGESSLPTRLPTDELGSAIDSGSEWGQHDNLSIPSSSASIGSNNTSVDANDLVRRPNTQNLQGLMNKQNNF